MQLYTSTDTAIESIFIGSTTQTVEDSRDVHVIYVGCVLRFDDYAAKLDRPTEGMMGDGESRGHPSISLYKHDIRVVVCRVNAQRPMRC